jgi:hypothetical protein
LYFSCQLSYTLYKTFYFHLSKARADDNNNPVDTNTNTAIDKSTNNGDDINPGIVTLKVKLKTIKVMKINNMYSLLFLDKYFLRNPKLIN